MTYIQLTEETWKHQSFVVKVVDNQGIHIYISPTKHKEILEKML